MSGARGPRTAVRIASAEHRRGPWIVERLSGPASGLLTAEEPPDGAPRRARLHYVDRPTLVLGSAQPQEAADRRAAAAAGVDVVRRRSGGGAVLLEPGRHVWVDFFVSSGDALWCDDVSRAAAWVGDLWAAAVASFVSELPEVHSGKLVADEWGELVCFAGAGPGEVFSGGLKLVGVSQRRSRRRARIQTMARLAPGLAPPGPAGGEQAGKSMGPDRPREPDLLALTARQRAEADAALARRCGAVPAGPSAVTEALLGALEAGG